MSTAGGYHDECGGYHEYSGGCSVHWGDTMMSVGGYLEYTGGCSVHWDFHTNSIVFPMTSPHIYHDISRCTHDIPPVY